MASSADSPEVAAIEAAYKDQVNALFRVLVTNLIDGPVSHQTEQQSADRFAAGLTKAKRARELALGVVRGTAAKAALSRTRRKGKRRKTSA